MEFVPYEQSLALKELGFDEQCFGWFRSTLIPSNFTEFLLETEFDMNESPSDWVNSNFLDKACSAPLYQQAFRWFREKHNIESYIKRGRKFKTLIDYQIHICNNDVLPYFGLDHYDTYEEAELACLKKLIEIVKTK